MIRTVNYTEMTGLATNPRQTNDTVQRVRTALRRCALFQNTGFWQRELNTLTAQQLSEVVERIVREEDSTEALERLAEFVPLEKLQEAIRLHYPNYTNALQDISSMLRIARHHLEAQNKAYLTPTLKVRLSKIVELLMTLVESVVRSFGLSDFFKPAENEFHADMKANKVMMIISLFTMLSGILIPIIGAGAVSSIVGGTLLGIAILGLIFPFIKPASPHLAHGQNWTAWLREGKLNVVAGRKGCVDEIARTLIASNRVKTHPMLIGKSGAGKTETVKAFVQAVERGDYPELKGKQIIYFNTATLVQHQEMFGTGNKILAKISEQMGRHRDQYILVFDEIHYALKEKENSAIGEELKTMLDPGSSNFPYVIGVTTEEEYYRDIYVEHAAFARRFKPIQIGNPQPHETLEILGNTILQLAPKALVEPDALSYLLDRTNAVFPDLPQPLNAQKILMNCIQATAGTQTSHLERQKAEVQSQIESFSAEAASLFTHQNNNLRARVQPLEETLRFIENQLVREKQQTSQLFQRRDNLIKMRQKTMEKVVEMAKFQFGRGLSLKQKKSLSAFLLMNYFKIPSLQASLKQDAGRIGIPMMIDRALIDRMIAEEQENNRRIEEARSRGREDLEARLGAVV